MTRKKNSISKSEVERIRMMSPTIEELREIDLKRDYRAIRKSFFGSSIPPEEEVLIRYISRKEIKRLCGYEDADGLCCFGMWKGTPCARQIFLADDLKPCESAISLLHEMAHMKVNIKFGREMRHGKYWKKEIRRLAAAGAYDGIL